MVKIFELTDSQLDSQIKKYKNILQELVNEKCKRIKVARFMIELDYSKIKNTDQEADEKIKSDVGSNDSKNDKGLVFNEDELQKYQEIKKDVEEDQVNNEEVGVTKLLRLSKDQLKQLKKK